MSAPRDLVLGTAGHIDHGKTSLVRALTGVDTDRLPEEKRRGITIELGFARWLIDGKGGALQVGIVDVPGHEALVRTMVAGAGGMDAVLLVIAAEDGVMPQTREHLHVCELLGLRHAVVALTKIDRLSEDPEEREELLELALEDVRDALAGTGFQAAPIVAVSAHSGEGMDALRGALEAMLRGLPGRGRKGAPVLPIDRVFTMRGHGTVITGTMIAGTLDLGEGEELELVAQGLGRARRSLRVRGMQVHGGEARRSRAGTRTALNLGAVAVEELARGDVLTRGPKVVASDRLLAEVRQLGFGQQPWARDATLQLCAGTASATAHLVPLGLVEGEGEGEGEGEDKNGSLRAPERGAGKPVIGPGQRGLVRIYLDQPLPIWAGQRVILRAFSATHMQTEGLTVGGGLILDPAPERGRPGARIKLAEVLRRGDASARLRALVEDAGSGGLDLATLAARSGVDEPGRALSRLSSDPGSPLLHLSTDAGPRWVARSLLAGLTRAALEIVDRFHDAQPLQAGLPRATLEAGLPGYPSPALARAAIERAVAAGELRVADRSGSVARPGKGALDPDDLPSPLAEIFALYGAAAQSPPTLRQVGEALALDAKEVLSLVVLLQRNGLLVRVSDDLSYAAEAHAAVLAQVRAHLQAHGGIDVQAIKALTGLSRKFVVPWLEYLDHQGVTRRVGDARVPGPKA